MYLFQTIIVVIWLAFNDVDTLLNIGYVYILLAFLCVMLMKTIVLLSSSTLAHVQMSQSE